MGVLTKLMPARTESTPRVIADFDALIADPIVFKFQGKLFEIKPVDTESFIRISQSLQKIQDLMRLRAEGKDTTLDEIYETYMDFIRPLCPDFKLKDLKAMALPQIGALVNVILKHVRGETAVEADSEKKNLKVS